ncbi:vesicular integral-membrane protein VIP36 precursor [Cladochytrium replicatum]|nr:vesicular integral-membrane protein VIP36 precursor [Cladochytrium replicatum]
MDMGGIRAMRRRWSSLLPAILAIALVLLGSPSLVNAEDAVEVENVIPLFSYNLQPPFIEENLNNRWWNFGGDALVDVHNHVRLTSDRQSSSGWIWSKVMLTSASWVLEFEFRVQGASNHLFGDGFAFWYSTEREEPGPVFGNKDKFTGLGLFFDTYPNGRARYVFPWVSAMLGDGNTAYDHDNDNKATELGGCGGDFRAKDWPTKAKVKYIKNGYLQVQLNVRGNDDWEDCFLVRNVSLPAQGYLGFTAMTGDVHDNHDILRLSVNSIVNPADYRKPGKPAAESQSETRGSKSSSGGGRVWVWLLAIFILVAVGYGAYAVYNQSQRRNLKRF